MFLKGQNENTDSLKCLAVMGVLPNETILAQGARVRFADLGRGKRRF